MHTDPTTSEKSGKPENFHDYETSEKGNKMAIYFLNMNEIVDFLMCREQHMSSAFVTNKV